MSDIYNSQDMAELILRHLLQSAQVMKKAKMLGLTPEDFLPAGSFHLPLYKIVADAILEIGEAPILTEVFRSHLQQKATELSPAGLDQLPDLLMRLLGNTQLMEAYVIEALPKFIKARRSAKIVAEADGDLEKLSAEYRKVIFPLDTLNDSEIPVDQRFVNPFATVLKKPICAMIPTGFIRLNAALGGGIGYREFGLIIGHSGGGKTAMGTSIARGAAMAGHKVIYCSMEEEKEDIANRMYAAVFEVDYTSLHNGSGYLELEQKMAADTDAARMKLLKENLVLLDLKGMTPMKPTQLKQLVDEYAAKNSFWFELLIVDQLQFMEPEDLRPNEQDWVREGRVVKELDEISHQPIADTNKYFGVWALHQAKGKVKIYFSNDEIAGFKGIIHKPETVLGIGRENPSSDNFEIFSLKNRHAKNFRQPMHGDLKFMTFIEKAEGPGDAHSVGAVSPTPFAGRTKAQTAMSAGNFQHKEDMKQLLTTPAVASGPPAPLPIMAGISTPYG